jgi:hypothetical protein
MLFSVDVTVTKETIRSYYGDGDTFTTFRFCRITKYITELPLDYDLPVPKYRSIIGVTYDF